jgi:hypothetical protein
MDVNYKCNRKHSFKGDENTRVCPECGSLGIFDSDEDIKTRVPWIWLIGILLLIIGIIIYFLFPRNETKNMKLDFSQNLVEGYIQAVAIEVNEEGNEITRNTDPDFLNKMSFRIENKPFEFKDDNRIYLCPEIEYYTIQTKSNFDYQGDKYLFKDDTLRTEEFKFTGSPHVKAQCNDTVSQSLSKDALTINRVISGDNCDLLIETNYSKDLVMISIDGENGNYETKEKWDRAAFNTTSTTVTLDVWAYLEGDGPQNAVSYPLNQTQFSFINCQGSNAAKGPDKSEFEGVLKNVSQNPSRLNAIRKLKRTDGKSIKFFIDKESISGIVALKNIFRSRSEDNPKLTFKSKVNWIGDQPSEIYFNTK